MSTATFNEIGHSYELDGVVVPSVTQILTLSGISDVSGIPAHILDRAAAIGTAVHQACEFLDLDDLNIESLDTLIVPYVLAYQRFRDEHVFVPALIEYRHCGNVDGLAYGMCVDRVGALDGQETVIDLKTSSKPQASWAIQTAAYSVGLADEIDYPGTQRAVVHLCKDGSYNLIQYRNLEDYEVWNAALKVAHWRLGHGAKIKDR